MPAQGAVDSASVALSEDGVRKIRWTSATPVDIRVSSGSGYDWEMLAEDVSGGEITFEGGLHERAYFSIEPENGRPVTTALRVLPLEGGRNFRDLGGYPTEDGKTVRWGKVYRSGVMHDLTDADYEYLSGLGIGVVCDFRAIEERLEEPTNWAAGDIDYLSWDYTSADSSGQLAQVFQDPSVTPEMVSGMMIRLYSSIMDQHEDKFRVMFDRLVAGDVPLAFNCSAGKDRTGIAAALLLSALGVEREAVVADYAMSEKVVDYMQIFADASTIDEDSPYAFLAQMPPDLVKPLLRSDPRYIESALASLEEEHGSVLAYIQTELGVDDDELMSLREMLLE